MTDFGLFDTKILMALLRYIDYITYIAGEGYTKH